MITTLQINMTVVLTVKRRQSLFTTAGVYKCWKPYGRGK